MTEKVKWGILGCSRIARTALIPALQASDQTELTGIASRNLQTAGHWAAEFDIPRSYGNYNDLVCDPDIDVVYIGLPNHLHWNGHCPQPKMASMYFVTSHWHVNSLRRNKWLPVAA